jgi:hypothetical protein
MPPAPINLRQRFGRKYRVRYEESYYAHLERAVRSRLASDRSIPWDRGPAKLAEVATRKEA